VQSSALDYAGITAASPAVHAPTDRRSPIRRYRLVALHSDYDYDEVARGRGDCQHRWHDGRPEQFLRRL